MITFISEEQLSQKTNYLRTDFIPESIFPTFTPQKYVESFGNNETTFLYLRKVSDYTEYVIQLLKIYEAIIEESEKIYKQESKDHKIYMQTQDLSVKAFTDKIYGPLNYKERLAVNRINCGKAIYKELLKTLDNPYIDTKLKEFILKTKDQRNQLPEKPVMETVYYKNILPEEDDIYYDYPENSMSIIESLLPMYFTPKMYFTNSGKSIFAVLPEDYLYLAGISRGKIKEYPKFSYYKNNYEKDLFNKIISELNILLEDLKEYISMLLISKKQEMIKEKNNNLKSDNVFIELKQMKGYDAFVSFIPEAEIYFKELINLRFITVFNGEIKFCIPCTQKVFAAIMKDPVFTFAQKLPAVPKIVFKDFFGKTINQMEQREKNTFETENYKNVKEALLKKNVPFNKKYL